MDETLERSWQNGVAPFDGVTVYEASDGQIPLATLRQSALAVVEILQQKFPNDALRILDDWHEHDGCVFPSSTSNWPKIRDHLSSNERFLFFKTNDFQVSKAIYSESMKFYLRVYIDDEPKPDNLMGEIDVTVPLEIAGAIADALGKVNLKPKTESAKTYFERRYGG